MVKQQQRRPDRCFLPVGSNSVTLVRFPAQRRQHPSVQHQQQAVDGGEGETSVKRSRGCEEALTNGDAAPESCDQTGSEWSAAEGGVQQVAPQSSEDSRAAEMASAGSLKVTIQRSSESREFGDKDPRTERLTCHICHLTCPTVQMFQQHMVGSGHQRRLHQITESVQINTTAHTTGWRCGPSQRWCDACQTHFTGDTILHRRTKQHKDMKKSSRPFCPVCRRHFRNPRKFVEHMKSPVHKQQVLEEKGEDEDLITVDAVGCFENEQDMNSEEQTGAEDGGEHKLESKGPMRIKEEKMDGELGDEEEHKDTWGGKEVGDTEDREDKEGVEVEELMEADVRHKEEQTEATADAAHVTTRFTTQTGHLTALADLFIIPVRGFLCRLCHKFFFSTARELHRTSHTHLLRAQEAGDEELRRGLKEAEMRTDQVLSRTPQTSPEK